MNKLRQTMVELIEEMVRQDRNKERRSDKADRIRRTIDEDFNERESARSTR